MVGDTSLSSFGSVWLSLVGFRWVWNGLAGLVGGFWVGGFGCGLWESLQKGNKKGIMMIFLPP